MTINLMIVPGPGLVEFELDAGATLGTLVAVKELFGRSLIVNGEGVVPDDYGTTTLSDGDEIWATGAVKGN